MSPVPYQPIYFGSPAAPLFGWYHPAQEPLAPFGVVICSPWGREEICAYRSMRYLAQACAAAGIPTLRFDYAGCGNSHGDDLEPNRIEAWLASVSQACETLKRSSGATKIILVGVRLGGTLACLAAQDRSDIAAIATISPVISGRSYVRELRVLQMTSPTAKPGDDMSLLENEGAVMPDETKAAVSALDLMRLQHAPAPSMLLLNRDDLPPPDNWANHVTALGVDLCQQNLPGYAGMMAPPHKTVIPEQMISATVSWIQRIAIASGTPTPVAAGERFVPDNQAQFPAETPGAAAITETALFFGKGNPLLGILDEPTDTALSSDASGKLIVLVSEGANRLVGPNRIYVPLARRWAAQGHCVLRFDLAGIGDSPALPGGKENDVYSARAHEDLASAIEFMRQRWPARDVHLLGLCSGAYHSYRAAVQGLPVRSTVLINPIVFFWEEGLSLDVLETLPESFLAEEVVRYKQSVWQVKKWAQLLSSSAGWRRLAQVGKQWITWNGTKVLKSCARVLGVPLQKDLHGELVAVAKRQVDQHFIFSVGDPGYAYLIEQGGSAVKRLVDQGRISIELIQQSNHSFSTYAPRQKLIQSLQRLIETPRSA